MKFSKVNTNKREIFLLAFVLISIHHQLFSQGVISGYVYDQNNEAINYCNIIIREPVTQDFYKGTITNDIGFYELSVQDSFVGSIEISALGYESLTSIITPDQFSYDFFLEPSITLLDEVQITARKTLFELKNDRLVVNVGSIPSFSGNSALQVLQQSPGVIVDENGGSISMNNKGEVLIMINNRVSRIPIDILIYHLKSIRAENIEKIELIHQPSAKYDSDNSAGIIHIVLKSNALSGFNGNMSLAAGYGQNEKGNGTFGANYRKNRFNIYGDISIYSSRSHKYQVNHEREYEYLGTDFGFLNEVVLTDYLNQGANLNIGLDYNLNENTVFGVLAGISILNEKGNDFVSNSRFFENSQLTLSTKNQFEINNPKTNQFLNINIAKTLNNNNSISFDIDRVQLQADNYGYFSSNSEIRELESSRNSEFQIWTFKGDYQQDFSSKISLETGIKTTLNKTKSTSLLAERIDDKWNDVEDFVRRDDINEMIIATYASLKTKFTSDLAGEFGVRYEQYGYNLEALNSEENLEIRLRNPFPIARLNYEIDSIRSINISFNRRTRRPKYGSLIAYQLLLDPTLYVSSNVALRPAFSNTVRVSYKYKSILTSIEANQTRNDISYYNTVDKAKGIQTSTPINIDKVESLIASLSFPIYYKNWLELNATLTSGLYHVFDASNRPVPFDARIFSHNFQLNNSFNFGKDWRANLGGRYVSPYMSGDQIQRIGVNVSIGISKKFRNGSIVFNIQDLTNTEGVIYWEYNQPELGIRTFGNNDFSERTFRITYSTTFGDQRLKAKRNRETGSQEERNRM